MIVSHSHQFVFVKTRKTAGTSAEIALSAFVQEDDIVTPISEVDEALRRSNPARGTQNLRLPSAMRWTAHEWAHLLAKGQYPQFFNHMPAARIRRAIGRDKWNAYLTFAVDRNPWDLAVSAWWWERNGLGKSFSFSEFVQSRALDKYSNWALYTDKDQVIVDSVVAYDRLDEGLDRICGTLGIPALDLPKAKADFRTDQRPFQEWYDGTTQTQVADVFCKEIDHFGWTF
jgi:hypothetical protein